jgi:Bacterial protein of unknown function (DUF922)
MKLLFLISFLSLFGKETSEDGIRYRTLSWSDFRGPVPEKTTFAAVTATQLLYEFESDEHGKYGYAVTAYFDPASSYVRLKSDAYLRHEQTHFAIAFLMAQECMLDLRPLQGSDSTRQKEVDAIYDRAVDKYNALNEQFDRETNHSVNVTAEKTWEHRIASQLAQLKQH